MEVFYIDVELDRGLTRFQVDEVPPEQWDMPHTPQFIVEYHNGREWVILILRLEKGKWYDRNSRLHGDEQHLNHFSLNADTWSPEYQSPLNQLEIESIGRAVSRHMVVLLQAYMGLFVPVFPKPAIN
ncbi:hypothetical protein [Mucilaginibacter myungsuensis]|uniref:Uncharacterized protein n=1 Tax=Mucilaginibacter myungsuensis TaxID=649104 RepID=A0A929PXR2_9SPHI|nr:hypothetical protein [Mucilaginibacter myungsuensis]MBE9662675.1 hypothetical protein [Mucilaginibacter myungsuensis]MDN3598095.1 hypothetical protein [Mucilaginibacter myungsuensis]